MLKDQSLMLERNVHEKSTALEEANSGLETQVSKRIESEHALEQSELKYQRLYDNAGAALFTSEMEGGCLIEANQMALSLFEATRHALVNKPTSDLWADLERYAAFVKLLLARGSVSNAECDFLTSSGTTKHCSVNAALDRNTGDY